MQSYPKPIFSADKPYKIAGPNTESHLYSSMLRKLKVSNICLVPLLVIQTCRAKYSD